MKPAAAERRDRAGDRGLYIAGRSAARCTRRLQQAILAEAVKRGGVETILPLDEIAGAILRSARD